MAASGLSTQGYRVLKTHLVGPPGHPTCGGRGCRDGGERGKSPPLLGLGAIWDADELLSNSLLPWSWGARGKIHRWGGWGRRSRAAGGGAGTEGLTGSVCSLSLVTKEKGTALGKETKHPLPRRVIFFPHAASQPLDPEKGSQHREDGVTVPGGREQAAPGECGCWGGGLGTRPGGSFPRPHHPCLHHPFPSTSSQSYGKMLGPPGTVVRSIRPYQSSEQYLYAMKEDLAEWLKELYDMDIEVGTFVEVLETGAVLCSHANNVTHVAEEFARSCPDAARHLRLPTAGVACNLAAQPGTFQARDNISNFIQWCRKEMDIKGKIPGSSCPVSPCAIPLQLLLASPQEFSHVSSKASATPALGSTVHMRP